MKRILFLLMLALAFALPAPAQKLFPDRCLGVWTGTMQIYRAGVVKDSVPVRLTVAKTAAPDAYTWKTEYLSAQRPLTKDYILRVKDAAKGIYITDEGGGVELFNYQFEDKLYNVFETGGVMLTATYELRGKELIFEVTAGKITADAKKDVTNYPVDNLQRVVFRKSKAK